MGAPPPQPSPDGRGGNRENHSFNTAIIGGGYAGMAAAVTLAEHNIPVTIFESARQLGGRARGVVQHDTQLDNGQHILLGCYRHTLGLIEQVGGNIKQDFQRLPLQLTLHKRFELKAPRLPAPLHLLTGFLLAKGLSYRARLHAARFMLSMRRINFKLKADISALELLQIHKQDAELIRLLWEPICISALNTPLQKASAQVLLSVLRDSLNGSRADSDMLLPRLDLSELFPNRAAQYVSKREGKIIFSCGVESITRHDNKFSLHTGQGTVYFDRVICATSASSAIRLFSALPSLAEMVTQIEAITYQPIYTVYLKYPAEVQLPHPMLGLDRCISQWLFDKGQIAGQSGLIAAVISAEGMHQQWSHEQLAQRVIEELCAQFGISKLPEWYQVIAEKRATFSCIANLSRPDYLTQEKNLLLAGDFTTGDYPATLEGAVISGIRCANEIIRRQKSC
jgi:squalene-associated FAD-dependent desaturase